MAFKNNSITIAFVHTREYTYTDSADVVAKQLGISVAALRRAVEGDADVDRERFSRLIDVANLDSEEYELDNIDSEEED